MASSLAYLLADGNFHSGSALGVALGLSRAAVWKQVQTLQSRGVTVDAVSGKGYRVPGGLDLLDVASIRQCPGVGARFPQIDVHDSIGSTNHVAMSHAKSGARLPFACLAEQQTAGKGRRGRLWVSPYARNVYLSVAWEFDGGMAAIQGLSLAVGVAMCEAVESFGIVDIGLKWPNDVVVGESKLGGILIEVSGDVGGPCTAIIGIGVNVIMPDNLGREIGQPWVDLHRMGCRISRNQVAGRLLAALGRILPQFSEQGFASVAEQWRRMDVLSGVEIDVHLGSTVITGRAVGVDGQGCLLVDVDGARRVLQAGEVSVRTRA